MKTAGLLSTSKWLSSSKWPGGVFSRAFNSAALLLLTVTLMAQAQEPASAPALSSSASAANAAGSAQAEKADEHYRIGPGDMLDIRIFNRPQFSRDGVRVDGRGMFRMPLLEGEIRAACRTEGELGAELTERYREFLRNPQVDVFIKEYQSQPVAVLGAVRSPSRFQLQRRVRLLEMLTFVGGPTDNAGRIVQIVHTAGLSTCDPPTQDTSSAENSGPEIAGDLDYFKLADTLRGDVQANPYVRPGDVISVPEADQIFVVGNVIRPSPISLKEPVTISRAIAMAGGVQPDTKRDKVRIVRQEPGSASKTEIFVDLKAIEKHQAEDIALQANDIVDVPVSGSKRILRSLVGAVVPSVAQLPVRVVP